MLHPPVEYIYILMFLLFFISLYIHFLHFCVMSFSVLLSSSVCLSTVHLIHLTLPPRGRNPRVSTRTLACAGRGSGSQGGGGAGSLVWHWHLVRLTCGGRGTDAVFLIEIFLIYGNSLKLMKITFVCNFMYVHIFSFSVFQVF